MPGIHTLHQVSSFEIILDTSDVDGTTLTSKYVDMSNYGTVDFYAHLGTTLEGTADGWDALDILSLFEVYQATDATGTSEKVLGTGANSLNANQTGVNVAGQIFVLTMHSEQLDNSDTDFKFAGVKVTESEGTSNAWITLAAVRYNPRYAHRELTTAVARQAVG